MKIRGVAISGLVFALACVLLWADGRRTLQLEARRTATSRLLPMAIEDVGGLIITRQGQPIEIVRRSDHWAIVRPIQAVAEEQAIAELLSYLDGQVKHAMAEASPEEMETFGLRFPALSVAIMDESEEEAFAFSIGEDSPVLGEVYARLGDAANPSDQSFTISSDLKNSLRRNLYNLREKSIVAFAPHESNALSLTYQGRTIEMAEQEDGWSIMRPIREAADLEQVDDVLNEIHLTRALDFLDTDSLHLERYGLDAPDIVAVLERPTDGGEAEQCTLSIGRRRVGSPPTYYALRSGYDVVFTVPQELVTKLQTGTQAFRSRTIFTLTPPEVAFFALDFGSAKVRLRKNSAGLWGFDDGSDDLADSEFVDGIIQFLLQTKIERHFLLPPDPASAGLDDRRLRVQVKDRTGERIEGIETGRVGETVASEDVVFARKLGGEEIFGVSIERPGKLFLTKDNFRDKTLFAFDPALVESFEVRAKGHFEAKYNKTGDSWTGVIDINGQVFQIGSNLVDSFLAHLLALKWKGRLNPTIERDLIMIKAERLEDPLLVIELIDANGNSITAIGQGKSVDKPKAYIRRTIAGGDPEYFALEMKVYQPFAIAVRQLLQQ